VQYEYKINYNFTEFIKNGKTSAFEKALFKQLNLDGRMNMIDYCKNGSVIVGGTYATSSEAEAYSANEIFLKNKKVSGFSILSASSFVAVDGQSV